MRKKIFGLIAATALALPMAAQAGTQTGTFNGQTWTAQSNVVGVTSTAVGGNPIYLATAPKYSGVAALIMTYQSGARFICSGSLTNGGSSVVTAAHCVAPHGADKLVSTTAYFGGSQAGRDFYNDPGTTAVSVGAVTINAAYTGEVIDQNDIAVLALNGAPLTGYTIYDLYTGGDLTGQTFNIAGYGGRSDTGGNVGVNLGTGRLRQGDNRYDFRLGDTDFAGGWTTILGGTANYAFTYLSDFDNGLAANDTSCAVASDPFFGLSGPKYCNTGVGALEVSTAGGDSGGPQFINGKLASVTSFGLTFGCEYGDIDFVDKDNSGTCTAADGAKLNSSFGEFNGFVPIFIHTDFLNRAFAAGVPEASTWMQMIFGFGLIGGIARRRKTAVSALV